MRRVQRRALGETNVRLNSMDWTVLISTAKMRLPNITELAR